MTPELFSKGTANTGTLVLAHGAGAGHTSPFMSNFQTGLADRGFKVILFDFPYMAQAIATGKRRPPDRAPKLIEYYHQVLKSLAVDGPLIIGGKSMGGRIASMLLAENPSVAQGLLLLGYPFHPPGKIDRLRTSHLPSITAPTLIVQGERDTFGNQELVSNLSLPPSFHINWIGDGDHSFKPRKASGLTEAGNQKAAMDAITAFKW